MEKLKTFYIENEFIIGIDSKGNGLKFHLDSTGWVSLADRDLIRLELYNCPNLTHLNVHYNQLTELDLSLCPKLTNLHCYDNNLTTLDLSNCPNLSVLFCEDNKFNSLDISKNKLNNLMCDNIDITGKAENIHILM